MTLSSLLASPRVTPHPFPASADVDAIVRRALTPDSGGASCPQYSAPRPCLAARPTPSPSAVPPATRPCALPGVTLAGRRIVNVDPLPGSLSTVMSPPITSTCAL